MTHLLEVSPTAQSKSGQTTYKWTSSTLCSARSTSMHTDNCLDLTWYEEISSRQSVWGAVSRSGGIRSRTSHCSSPSCFTTPSYIQQTPMRQRKDYSLVYRSCYVYVKHPDPNNAECSKHKTKSKSYWGWSRHQPIKSEIWPELNINAQYRAVNILFRL